MNKLDMAHEYFMKHGRNNSWMESDVIDAWKYADAMQAEADKREPSGFPNVLRGACGEIVAVKVDDKEWQPDWSQAPENANYWSITDYGKGKWHSAHAKTPRNCGCAFGCENSLEWDAPDFGYTGNWQESLRKRP